MKKMISKFADSLLSREDLKRVKGGYGGAGCSGTTESDCSGECNTTGNVCGWVKGSCVCTYQQ